LETVEREKINPRAGHQDSITGVGFTRDGKELISASEDDTVRFSGTVAEVTARTHHESEQVIPFRSAR
jgi:hypothetical protein